MKRPVQPLGSRLWLMALRRTYWKLSGVYASLPLNEGFCHSTWASQQSFSGFSTWLLAVTVAVELAVAVALAVALAVAVEVLVLVEVEVLVLVLVRLLVTAAAATSS